MRAAHFLADSLRPVLDLVLPPRCPACSTALGDQGGLCPDCWSALVIPGPSHCAHCQQPLDAGEGEGVVSCRACQASPPRHGGIVAATLYGDVSRQLLLKFKHGRRIALAPMLARMIAARLGPPNQGRVLVPVPLHRWRLWKRGYNQAALLAGELARLGHGTVCVDALLRTRPTPSLGGLGARARVAALEGAIALRRDRAVVIAGRDVILVDDVLTSGATSEACARILRAAGARSVQVACFARVVDDGPDRNWP